MERNWDLSEWTDGRKYKSTDLVKVGCNDCRGCSACCHNMGESIVLDPMDIYRLTTSLHQSMEELLTQAVELNVVDGVILPNLKMQEATGGCLYLNPEGRCRIHEQRPGICRLFPLGRLYEEQGFSYILQVHECKAKNKTKVKVRQWLQIADLNRYESYICDWHILIKNYQTEAKKGLLQGEALKQQNLKLLQIFYFSPYDASRDFYPQYQERRQML